MGRPAAGALWHEAQALSTSTMKAVMSKPGFRMLQGVVAVLPLALATGACDIGPESRTRVNEALLSAADLKRVQSLQATDAAPTSRMTGACAQIESVIAQLTVIGAGRLKFSGSGVLDLDERAWSRLPVAQRNLLLKTLAAQNRCKTGAAKGSATIRGASGARVIDRFREL